MGHDVSFGHSTVSPSLTEPNPDPNIYYIPQQDDKNGIYDRLPWKRELIGSLQRKFSEDDLLH